MIAVHTDMASETAPDFIEKYYPDSKIIFAKDNEGESYYSALGGRDAYPYTVILNKQRNILATFAGSVSYQELKEIAEANCN